MYLVCKKLRTCKKTIATFVENDYIFLFERIIGVLNQSDVPASLSYLRSYQYCCVTGTGTVLL